LVSIIFVLLGLFFPARFFSLAFLSGTVSLSLFFPPPLTPSFAFGELLPTYRPSSYQPTYIPHPTDASPPTSFCTHLYRQSLQTKESLSSLELQLGFKVQSFGMWRRTKLQERESKRSFKVVA
jgi:hypothetical protein